MRLIIGRMISLTIALSLLQLPIASPASSKSGSKSSGSKSKRNYGVTQYSGSSKKVTRVGKSASAKRGSRSRRTTHHRHTVAKAKPKYAYPLEIFMMKPPSFDTSPLTPELSQKVIDSFHNGIAEKYPARSLVRSGLVTYHPLRGGIYWRREPVKYIIVHSTETGIPLSAIRVIESWSSMGRRHPGAQYVVERDGTIYQAVDPDLATVHVNIFKTRAGINNDNSIGIEMCHTGKQVYTKEQTESTIKLVSYLQDRYGVSDEFVTTHRWAQQGDHTDPVGFDWKGFLQSKYNFRRQAIANKLKKIEEDAQLCWSTGLPQAPVYMQPHKKLKKIEDSLPQTQQNQQKPQNQQTAPEEKQKPKESPKENPTEDKSPLIVPVSVQPPKKEASPQAPVQANLKGPIEMSPELLKQLK